MKKGILHFALATLCITACITAMPVMANVIYSFHHIGESEDPAGTSIIVGENSLFVEASYFAEGETLFKFINTGGYPEPYNSHFIRGVYFYDGVLSEIASLVDADQSYGGLDGHPDVDFSEGASNATGFTKSVKLVPGYELVGDADNDPGAFNGVHPDEWLGVVFRHNGTFNDVISGLNNNDIIIGIHVGGFGEDDYSEKFVTYNTPASGAVLLGGIGIVLVGWLRRRGAFIRS
ncbi:MAG: hypothetical protein ACYSTN_09245 [Planctomycetota bacterium]|jgi:hypothetical protein